MKRPVAFKLFINGYVAKEMVTVDLDKVSAVQDDGRAGSMGGGGTLVALLVEGQWIRVSASYGETVLEVFGDDDRAQLARLKAKYPEEAP
jgi:hypothetical protein